MARLAVGRSEVKPKDVKLRIAAVERSSAARELVVIGWPATDWRRPGRESGSCLKDLLLVNYGSSTEGKLVRLGYQGHMAGLNSCGPIKCGGRKKRRKGLMAMPTAAKGGGREREGEDPEEPLSMAGEAQGGVELMGREPASL